MEEFFISRRYFLDCTKFMLILHLRNAGSHRTIFVSQLFARLIQVNGEPSEAPPEVLGFLQIEAELHKQRTCMKRI